MGGTFLEIPAVHEAGRAVLCSVFNKRIDCITIDRQPHSMDEVTAEIARGLGSLRTSEAIQRARQEAMICCAGDIAAHIHLGRQLRKHELAGKPTIDWTASIAVSQFAVPTRQLACYIDAFLEDTRAELDAHWPKVERLAAVLLKRRSLSADEAAWILMKG